MMKQLINAMPQRIAMLLCALILSVGAFAQQIVVKGHVKDDTGEPITGATVRVVGQEGGVVTDIDGNFSISANTGAEITVSYCGYYDTMAPASANMVIVMKDDAAKSLNEVVVIGYGVVKKSALTGSVSALKPDSKNKGLVVNPQDMLSGKVAGVNITTDGGAPGAGSTIRIRGGSSLNASNNPLIVIDGVAMDHNGVQGLSNPLSMINPQDIESFNVLKDASAAAIYGSRGSNGVIIITTKKGRKGMAPQISYNGSVTASVKSGSLKLMNGDEYREFITNKYGAGSDAAKALGTANTDWQNEIYRTALSHDHNVAVQGAFKNLPYRVSVGYTGQQGILKTSDFKRVTAAVNLNPSLLNDHLTLNLNAKGMFAETNYPNYAAIGDAFRFDPTQSIYDKTSADANNFAGYFQWRSNGAFLKDPNYPFSHNNKAPANPVAALDLYYERAYSRSFVGSADIDYKVHGFEDLRLHLTLGADISEGTQNKRVPATAPAAFYYGSYGAANKLKRNLSLSMYAQYFKDFNEKHHFDVMGGYEWQHYWRDENKDYRGFYPITNTTAKRGMETEHEPFHSRTENYLVSFFGRANYTFLNRYFLTATVRDDGSSRFKKHWAWFPSFAFAWKAKEENFLKDVNALSDLKLRLGWGKTGQQDEIGDYNYFAIYNINTGTQSFYPILENGRLNMPQAYDPLLMWETTTTFNVGIDWGVLNQRLSGSIDWYYRNTTDLINNADAAAGTNFKNRVDTNIGSLRNTGVEATLSWKAIQSKDWYWTIDYNVTYNQNRITDLVGANSKPIETGNSVHSGTGTKVKAYAVGQSASAFYVYQQAYDANGKAIEGAIVDRNEDGIINNDDRYFYKQSAAPVTMGLASRLEYKKWDFGISFRANIGNYVYNDVEASRSNMNELWNSGYLEQRPKSTIDLNWQTSKWVQSDYFVRNASFLKCDNITLGYSFERVLKTGSWHGLSGRLYATASNVFTISKYKGLDPEVFNGIDYDLYPRPTSFILGLSLNF